MNDVIDEVEVRTVSVDSSRLAAQERQVVREAPLTIEIKNVGTYTIMCTPCDTVALAVGFAFSEGLIESRDDINLLTKCPDDSNVIRMQLAPQKEAPGGERRLLIVSSCGMCGSEDMEKLINSLPKVADNVRLTGKQLVQLTERLRTEQEIFQRTGGTHAAGIVRDEQLIAAGEDVGRHNAFDKAIGRCLLDGINPAATIAVLSGRISFELVAKAARTGVELIAAVSAPSTLAIEVARRCRITLCGFVRQTEATIYSHPHRIE
ncbi:MAG: hypothetical protein AMJ79_02765 [Phycisphaerae bacterium SM23_30]|nr:MAG: hypothetical protein AMJ79_02765 [Phycisphaerae bacterium SM23_30]